jgi:amidohydrolase
MTRATGLGDPFPLDADLAARVRAAGEAAVRHRHALHEIPERGFEEHETARYLEHALAAHGIAARTGIAGTGLVAELPGAGPGPTVMLRSDMDGLPIEEDPTHVPRSRRPGFMHACGHDGHMAILLGVAEAVTRAQGARPGPLPGRIVLLFQPAEENGPGAARVVEEGVLDAWNVDYVLGLHLWSFLPRGLAIVPDGHVMASSDEFHVYVGGKGGHGALPHEAQDVVLALSHLVVALQHVVSREIDPLKPAVLSVGKIAAGHACNVLPERGELHGTFRAPDGAVRGRILHRIGELAQAIALAHGVSVEVDFGTGYPPTVNDPKVARVLREAARAVLGESEVREGPPTMAAEDFAIYLQQRPGAFMLLGMRDEAQGAVHPHHNPRFRVADEVLPTGVEILIRAALRLMRGEAAR